MIECRYCRDVFRKSPEKIGARCPTCRMPLFDRERQRTPVVDLGACTEHQEVSAVAKCQRCGKMMCPSCRTRWDEEIVCPACLDKALASGETNPRQTRTQNRQAVWSLVLALAGWTLYFFAFWPLTSLIRGTGGKDLATFTALLFLASLLPALFAIGQGVACLRTRGQRLAMAGWGVSLAGAHLGLALGLFFLNVWHN